MSNTQQVKKRPFWKQFASALKRGDAFGIPNRLYHKGEEIYQTTISAILTFIAILAVLGLCIPEITSVLGYEKYSYSQFIDYRDEYPFTDLDTSNFPIAVGIPNHSFDEAKVGIRFRYSDYTRDSDGAVDPKNEYKAMVPCREDMFKGFEEIFNLNGLSNFLCPEDDTYSIGGSFQDPRFQFISIRFEECDEEIHGDNGITCDTEENIEEYWENNTPSANIYFLSTSIDPTERKQPFVRFLNNFFQDMNKDLVKETNVYIDDVIFRSYESSFSSSNPEDTNFFGYHSKKDDFFNFKQDDDNEYFKLYFRKSNQVIVHNRRYENVATLIAYIGGIFAIIIRIFRFLGEYVNKITYEKEIADEIYNYEDIDEDVDKKKEKKSEEQLKKEQEKKEQEKKSKDLEANKRKVSAQEADIMGTENLDEIQLQLKKQHSVNTPDRVGKQEEMRRFLSAAILSTSVAFDSIKQYMWHSILCCKKKRSIKYRLKQQEIALSESRKKLDIIHIIRQLQEFEKLKNMLFDHSQKTIFDYVQKPLIQAPAYHINGKIMKPSQPVKESFLRGGTKIEPDFSTIEGIKELYKVYQLVRKDRKNIYNTRLSNMLGAKVVAIFNILDEMNNLHNIKDSKLYKFYKVKPKLMMMIRLKLAGQKSAQSQLLDDIKNTWKSPTSLQHFPKTLNSIEEEALNQIEKNSFERKKTGYASAGDDTKGSPERKGSSNGNGTRGGGGGWDQKKDVDPSARKDTEEIPMDEMPNLGTDNRFGKILQTKNENDVSKKRTE